MKLNPEIASQLNLSHGITVVDGPDRYTVRGPWFECVVSKRDFVEADDDQPKDLPTSPRQLRDIGDHLARLFS